MQENVKMQEKFLNKTVGRGLCKEKWKSPNPLTFLEIKQDRASRSSQSKEVD